jgi:ankyrin repeat domain-containing protein 17
MNTNAMEKLNRLNQLINEPVVKSRMPDGYYDGITEHLNTIREKGLDAINEQLLQNLIELVDEYEEWFVKYANLPKVFSAASEGKFSEVQRALDEGFDIHKRDPDGMTLLMLGASGGHLEVASLMLDKGSDVLALSQDGNAFDALMMACANGHADMVKLLLDNGANINKRYSIPSSRGHVGNQTALSLSANKGHIDVCQLLILRGAEIDVAADSGYTALMWALVNGASEKAAEFLLNSGANPDPRTQPTEAWSDAKTTPLILAASNGLTDIALRLIEAKVNLDTRDGSGST